MIISGTGHRPNKLGGYSREAGSKLFTIACDYLKENKPDRVISGMALGWDTALAEAASALGIPFTAAVPFKEQPSAWPESSQDTYNILLGYADEVIYVCDDGYAPWKMQTRNVWMVDNCDEVLALWDGSDGGTGNCVKYAMKVGKPITNLWGRYANA